VLVLDLHLPRLGGMEVARQVRALLQLGARGYLGRAATGDEIVAAVRTPVTLASSLAHA